MAPPIKMAPLMADDVIPMLQFMAKAQERAFLDLRAHLTAETDRLAAGLKADAARDAALALLKDVLPAIDEIDEVLRALGSRMDAAGSSALGSVRRRLRDSFERMGISEIRVERGTPFDPAIHEGIPSTDGEAIADLPPQSVVAIHRAGFRAGDRLVRAPIVTITPE